MRMLLCSSRGLKSSSKKVEGVVLEGVVIGMVGMDYEKGMRIQPCYRFLSVSSWGSFPYIFMRMQRLTIFEL